MGEGILAMSSAERERLVVIGQVSSKVLRQGLAAERLGLCVRQVKRLVRAYRERGDAGLVSRQRGRASNRRLGAGATARVKGFLLDKYKDFGPTLAAEKLAELSRCRARRFGGFRSNSGFGSRSGGVISGGFNCASGVRASAS